MLPQQKPQVQVELKATCNVLWGQTVTCVYTSLLKHLQQQFWGLSIHPGLILDLYSQLVQVPLTWVTPHGKHREHPALIAPTKASSSSLSTHQLSQHPTKCLPALTAPTSSHSTQQNVPQLSQHPPTLLVTTACSIFHLPACVPPIFPRYHSHSQAGIPFLCRMG